MPQIFLKLARLMPSRPFLLPALLLGIGLTPGKAAFADATTEAQLRAALQQATSQIADLENQLANLQAEQVPDQAQIAALQAQLQTLKQQGGGAVPAASPAQKDDADKQVAELNERLAAQAAALDKAQAAYGQAATVANTNAAANQQLTAELAALRTQNSSCQIKNAALYQIGNQILDAYAHKDDLWGTIDKEPFIGIERVKLQNTVQDDQEKLDNNQVVPDAAGQGGSSQ
jgi:chromosome segregation ATPase